MSFRTYGFRDRRLKPLGHLSKVGGEGGIRTHESLLRTTRFPGVPLRPLGHLSKKLAEGGGVEPPCFATPWLSRPVADRPAAPSLKWRRGWDSDPRHGKPCTGLATQRLRPLGHLSITYASDMSENQTVGCEPGAAGGSRTPTPLTAYGFGPCASAYSATAASLGAAERHRTSTWSPTRASEARPSAISSTTAKPGADERTRTSTWFPIQRSERCSSASSDTSAGRTWYREGDSDPHAPCGVLGSKPSASACSAIPANLGAVGGNRTPTPLAGTRLSTLLVCLFRHDRRPWYRAGESNPHGF